MSNYLNMEMTSPSICLDQIEEKTQFVNNQERSDLYYITSNLNKFYNSVHNYYFHGGIRNILLNMFLNIAIIVTTDIFILYTFAYIDWSKIVNNCKYNHGECSDINYFINYNVTPHPIIILYLIITTSYSIAYMYSILSGLYYNSYIKYFYQKHLGINNEYLNIITWEKILDMIKDKNDKKQLMIERFNSNSKIDKYIVMSRITQYTNCICSLINSNLLFKDTCISNNILFTKYIENISKKFIINKFLDISHHNIINEYKIKNMQNNILLVIFINTLLLPFTLLFMMTYYILKNSKDINNKENVIFEKKWTNYALWNFRIYNESEHDFQERINKSYFHMSKYANYYPPKALNCILYFLRFFIGMFLIFILIISIIEEKALIDLKYMDYNLLWYFATLTILTAILNNSLKSKNFEETDDVIVKNLTKYIYTIPPKDIVNNYNLYKEFIKHYKTNIEIVFYEIISIILSPYILYKCYYKNAKIILYFMNETTKYDEYIGNIDLYSKFNSNLEIKDNLRFSQLCRKREKSYIAFKNLHPDWNDASDDLNRYFTNVENYNRDEEFPSIYASELFSSQFIESIHDDI